MLQELERAYVQAPDFSLVAIGAAQALEDLAPQALIRLAESAQETSASYATANGDSKVITFTREMTRPEATEALRVLYVHAREATPALSPVELEHAMMIRGLRRLDPDSSFLDHETYRELRGEAVGDFGGAGLEVTYRLGALTVVSPIDDAPAERAGVQAGDRIEKIDGVATKDLSLVEVVRRLRGRPRTKVTLTVDRDGWSQSREIEIVREKLIVSSVSSRDLGHGVAYIRIRRLLDGTAHDLDRALTSSAPDLRGAILDLRNNPGGLLTAAIEVADRFLPSGTLIAYTEGRLRSQNIRFKARATTTSRRLAPLVVLVNHGTAAGAEIVAGALQEWKRATLVGTRTFGRASIQSIIPLADGTALRLTTARCFTPKGRLVQDKGLIPDLVVEGEIPPFSSASTISALLQRDEQLRAALAQISGLLAPKPRP